VAGPSAQLEPIAGKTTLPGVDPCYDSYETLNLGAAVTV
jgi:hypothetical protein